LLLPNDYFIIIGTRGERKEFESEEINTKGVNSVFYSAFNSFSNKDYLIDKKFIFVNSMQQTVICSLFVHGHKLSKPIDYSYKKCNFVM
jgi:hypothetical protein